MALHLIFHFLFLRLLFFHAFFIDPARWQNICKLFLSDSTVSINAVKGIINKVNFVMRKGKLSLILEEPLDLIGIYESISVLIDVSPEKLGVIYRHDVILGKSLFLTGFFVDYCFLFGTCFKCSCSWEVEDEFELGSPGAFECACLIIIGWSWFSITTVWGWWISKRRNSFIEIIVAKLFTSFGPVFNQ